VHRLSPNRAERFWISDNGTDVCHPPTPRLGRHVRYDHPLVRETPRRPTVHFFNGTIDFVVQAARISGRGLASIFVIESRNDHGCNPDVPAPLLDRGPDRCQLFRGSVFQRRDIGSKRHALPVATDFANGKIESSTKNFWRPRWPGDFTARHA